MKKSKIIFLLLILSLFTTKSGAQMRSPEKIKIIYDTLNNKTSESDYGATFIEDSVPIVMCDGFRNDKVSIRINGGKIFDKTCTTSETLGCAGEIDLACDKKSTKFGLIELKINNGKWLKFRLDYRFNYVYVTYHSSKIIIVTISNQEHIFM
ncbi:MAG: hypothetical protein ABI199_06640 [Bacteroidia bacterium]